MNGIDDTTSALALAKQILPECEGTGEITLSKATLKILLIGFINQWSGEQDRKRAEFKKVAS